jgi:hypothetical protein
MFSAKFTYMWSSCIVQYRTAILPWGGKLCFPPPGEHYIVYFLKYLLLNFQIQNFSLDPFPPELFPLEWPQLILYYG